MPPYAAAYTMKWPGTPAATAAIMKQSGAAFIVFIVCWIARCAVRERAGGRAAARRLAAAAAGFGLPIGLMFAAAPVLCLLMAAGIGLLLAVRRRAPDRAFVGAFSACSFLAVCPGLYFSPHYLIQLLPAAAVWAGLIPAGGPPGARIAVLGSEPEICFYARRRAVTGYLYLYPLLEDQPFAAAMQREFTAPRDHGLVGGAVPRERLNWLHSAPGRSNVLG